MHEKLYKIEVYNESCIDIWHEPTDEPETYVILERREKRLSHCSELADMGQLLQQEFIIAAWTESGEPDKRFLVRLHWDNVLKFQGAFYTMQQIFD